MFETAATENGHQASNERPAGRVATVRDEALIATAQRLADDVLFPLALAVDQADEVPRASLDALAAAGLYGLTTPRSCDGLEASPATAYAVIEALAGGCLTTTFVWQQHLGAARAAALAVGPVREWATPFARGERRSGVAFAHLRRPGPPAVVAAPNGDGGWVVRGEAPWVTGWGRIDVVHTAAVCGDDVVWSLVDATTGPSLSVERLRLAALDASATVVMRLRDHLVPAERVTAVEPLRDWLARDALGLRANGSLALGVTGRACRLLGPSPLDDEMLGARAVLDAAGPEAIAAARAGATALAMRATSALVAIGGGRAVVRDQHAQRLAREAMFLLVQGQTPAIRAAQAALFTGRVTPAP
jgi:alkylation response protein AidB-like acyl-CoA dehydrogenase